MAKHPVPKKKKARARGRRQYAEFARKKKARLAAITNVHNCPDCGSPKLRQKICLNCGKFRGIQIVSIDKKIAKITKVKA